MQKHKIIYVAPSLSTFVRNDISFLSEKNEVIVNTYNWKNNKLIPIYMVLQAILILKHIRSTKAIIISFGGYLSFIPSLLGKILNTPTYIILNGTDCASLPSINYGSLRKSFLKFFCEKSYKMATCLLPVSSSLVTTNNTYNSTNKESLQGYKHYFPDITTKHIVISNGFNPSYWKKNERIDKVPNTVITVFSSSQFILKGGDLILKLSKQFPECTFYIAGCEKPSHAKEEYNNVKFLGRLTSDELKNYFSTCQFHFQLSIYEGFGCSLCEAMLCECIPIGSSVNIIPEIIGDTGFILDKRNSEKLNEIFKLALNSKDKIDLGKKARNKIASDYTIKKREDKISSIIDNN